MGKEGDVPPGPPGQQQAGGAATGGGATGGTPAGAGATGTKNKEAAGAKHKEVKGLPPPQHPPPVQVLQLTPEIFQQTIAAAVTAALQPVTAALAASQRPADSTPAAATGATSTAPVIPRKEKKLAEFWTSRPTMWFRLFDGQYPETMTENDRFNALLNHLPSTALPFVDHVLRTPEITPFARAKACLMKHYEVSPRDRARTLRSLTSLGDKTPSEMLHYMRSLLPGAPDNALFEAIFIDLLPANARDAAVRHEKLEDMAEAADKVLAEAPLSHDIAVVNGHDAEDDYALAQVRRQPSGSGKKSRDPSLCFSHAKYGRSAYKCHSPRTCRMRDVVIKPPTSGNANAARQ